MHISKRAASVVAAACASVVGCAAFGASYGQTATASFMNNSNSFNTTALANAINLANGYTGSTEIEIEGFGTVQLTGALPALSTPGSITISGDGGIIFAAPGTDASETSPGNGPPVFNGATPGLTAFNVTNGDLTLLTGITINGGNGGNDNFGAVALGASDNLSGGSGVAFGSSGILSNGGSIAGGNGGADTTVAGGGDGGTGVIASSANASVDNTGTIAGGSGGQGNTAGGNGGAGIQFNASGFVINSGTISGGSGGQANIAAGNGGTAISFGGGGSLNNSGTITGGSGNVATPSLPGGNGGNGVWVSGGGSVINSGTITGGGGGTAAFSSAAGTAGAAIAITGGVGTFTNQNHGVINGNVSLDNYANVVTLQIGSTINGVLNVGTSTLSALTLTDDGTGGTGTYSTSVGSTQFFGQLIKSGNGEWVMDQAVGYLGGTALNAGTLSVPQNANLGNDGSSLSFNGGVLQITGTSFNSTSRTINWGASGGGIDVANAGNTFTVSQSLSSGGTLTKFGAGTLVLGGSADNVGLGAVVNTGTLVLAKSPSGSSVHAIGDGGLTINNNGAVQLAGSNGDQIYDGAGVAINGGTFDLNGNAETIAALNGASGAVTNSNSSAIGALTVSGGGSFGGVFGTSGNGIALIVTGQTLTLAGSNDNSYLGATVDNGGTLVLAKNSNAGVHAIGGGLTINTGGTVQLAGSGGDQIFDSNILALNGGTFDLDGNSETIGVLNGTGSVTNSSSTAGTLTVSGGGSFGGVFGTSGDGINLVVSGQTLTLAGSVDNSYLNAIVNAGTLVLAKEPSGNAHAVGEGLTINSGGTVELAGLGNGQTYAYCPVVINGGLFDLSGESDTIGSFDGNSGTVTNNGAGVATFAVGSGGTFNGVLKSGSGELILDETGNDTLTLGGSNDNGSLAVIVDGGTLILNKSSSNSPDVHAIGNGLTLNNGVVKLAGSGGDQIYDGNSVTLNGGTFDMNGRSETIGPLNGNAGIITNTNAGTLSALTISGGGSFSGSITDGAGSVALAKTGSNTLALTGSTSTFSGGTSVAGGTLQVGDGTDPISLAGATGVSVGFGSSAAPTPGSNAIVVNSASTITVAANATVQGGNGGGFLGSRAYTGQSAGIGIAFSGGGTLNNAGTISGGSGQTTETNAAAANGAAGVTFSAGGSSFENTGTIWGGNGGENISAAAGNGGIGVEFGQNGKWSNSGTIVGGSAGVSFSNSDSVGAAGVQIDNGGAFANIGTIDGGTGGTAAVSGGTGGNGITFGSGGTIINAGTIQAGAGGTPQFSGSPGAAGKGIWMTGGVGTFTNQNGGLVNGDVILDNFANNVTLQIGSTINGDLNAGTSSLATLTLTDAGGGGSSNPFATVTGTTSLAGKFIVNVDGASAGSYGQLSAGAVTLTGSTLQFNLNAALSNGQTLQIISSSDVNGTFSNTTNDGAFAMGSLNGLEYYGIVNYTSGGVDLDDFFTESVPEPASATGLIIASSGLLMRRRRRAKPVG